MVALMRGRVQLEMHAMSPMLDCVHLSMALKTPETRARERWSKADAACNRGTAARARPGGTGAMLGRRQRVPPVRRSVLERVLEAAVQCWLLEGQCAGQDSNEREAERDLPWALQELTGAAYTTPADGPFARYCKIWAALRTP